MNLIKVILVYHASFGMGSLHFLYSIIKQYNNNSGIDSILEIVMVSFNLVIPPVFVWLSLTEIILYIFHAFAAFIAFFLSSLLNIYNYQAKREGIYDR